MAHPPAKIGFIFPGQGAVPESPPTDFIGTGVAGLYQKQCDPNAPPLEDFYQSRISSDESAQLGVFTLSLGMAEEALRYCRPDIITGYSSGLYAAMTACGCLTPAQGNRAVRLAYSGVKQMGTTRMMVGVIGLGFRDVEQILHNLHPAGELSLINNRSQVIVSIEKKDLISFKKACLDAGGLHIIPLPFTYPYHVAGLQETGRQLSRFFASLELPPLLIPMVAGSIPEYISTDSSAIAELVASQLYQPVWWYKTIQKIMEQGTTTLIVFDPTGTLTRIIRWISRTITVIGIETMADLNGLQDLQ
jgi:[acyl-carrier-protein] S-malonyltransferase